MDQHSRRTILFVDDEPRVLEGLRNMLRKMSHEWEMRFAGSGEQALAHLEQHPVELVVADMMMPVMDGAQLLTQIKQRWPRTAARSRRCPRSMASSAPLSRRRARR